MVLRVGSIFNDNEENGVKSFQFSIYIEMKYKWNGCYNKKYIFIFIYSSPLHPREFSSRHRRPTSTGELCQGMLQWNW